MGELGFGFRFLKDSLLEPRLIVEQENELENLFKRVDSFSRLFEAKGGDVDLSRLTSLSSELDEFSKDALNLFTPFEENLRLSLDALRRSAEASTSLGTSSASAADAAKLHELSAKGIADNLERAVRANQALSTGSTFQNQALGGSIQGFASGGFARGTDTVPAMLSPGEFVVGAKQSQRFFSQLQAINAGVQPQFRSEGGGVTIQGDINVTNNAKSVDADMNGRQIAQALNREIRRGTVRLRNQ